MKKLLLSLLFLSTFVLAQVKIGYVDSQVIMAQYPPAIKAQSDLENIVSEWQSTMENMKKQYQKIATDYQKGLAAMNDDAKKSASQDLMQREQEISAYQQTKFGQGGELYTKQEELMKPIRAKIVTAIEVVAKEENMKFIFDKTVDAFLLFADEEYDMTYKVLDKLKRGK